MKTILTNSPKEASKYILKSNVVAFPTETVYGLGANAFDEKAVWKIFEFKRRPYDNPLIVHISDKKQIKLVASSVNEAAAKLIKKYFPGPLTIILKKHEIVPFAVTAGLDTVAVRMPSSRIARDFIKECGVPIAAPSANLSGAPSPTGFRHVLEDFNGRIPCILIGPRSKYGLESTVIDCSAGIPRVLRPGVITIEELRKIDKRIRQVKRITSSRSPGVKYRHYSPKAKVIILKKPAKHKLNRKSAFIGMTRLLPSEKSIIGMYKHCKSKPDYAKSLYSFFRECDSEGIKTIYAEVVEEKGIGLAIMNRLKKARHN